jgi:hypothetical protein
MLEFLSQAMSGSLAATCRLSMGRLTLRANTVYRAIVSLPAVYQLSAGWHEL